MTIDLDAATPPRHDSAGPPLVGDVDSLPSHAERARTVVGHGGLATLGTLTRTGHPYTSLVAYVAGDDGAPLLCISEMAEHTRNARRDDRVSLHVVADGVPDGADPLAHARLTIVGSLVECDASAEERDAYHAAHPHSTAYTAFEDFNWWRLDVRDARLVGGFGVMSWIGRDDYSAAEPDPVVAMSQPVAVHMNADHADACLAMAVQLAGVADAIRATFTAIDRDGVDLAVETPGGQVDARVAFDARLAGGDDVRPAVIALARRARDLAGPRA